MSDGSNPTPRDPNTRARVLIVDDDGDVCDMLVATLERGGHFPAATSDPAEALRLLDAGSFDVALVDINMPELDGPDLLPLLHAKQQHLQVIMMTGAASVDAAVRSLRAGASDFIEKPLRPAIVVPTLERALARRRLDRTTALYQSSQTIFDAQHFDSLPESIVRVAMQVMAADSASLLLPAMDGKLYLAHAYGLDAELQKSVRITLGQGVAGQVAASGRPTIINGRASDVAEFAGSPARQNVKCSIVYPLVSGSRLIGLLTFNRRDATRPYRQLDLDQASVLASQVMLALENMRLARQTAITEKLAAVGQLAAGVAHEINTPIQFVGDGVHYLGEVLEDLTRLLSAYQKLADACKSKVDTEELFAEIEAIRDEIDVDDLRVEIPKALLRTKDGLARVTSIIRSIKSFGRPDTATKEPTDLKKVIEATLTVARGEYKYVADVETCIEDLPLVDAYPGELSQVFLNLIVNAAHAIADRANATESAERGKITVEARVAQGHVVISVADTGTGISRDLQQKIFDPFFTTKAVGRGTGLGLSIARGIVVDKHGGDLSVESEPGVGSRFSIRLPIGGR